MMSSFEFKPVHEAASVWCWCWGVYRLLLIYLMTQFMFMIQYIVHNWTGSSKIEFESWLAAPWTRKFASLKNTSSARHVRNVLGKFLSFPTLSSNTVSLAISTAHHQIRATPLPLRLLPITYAMHRLLIENYRHYNASLSSWTISQKSWVASTSGAIQGWGERQSTLIDYENAWNSDPCQPSWDLEGIRAESCHKPTSHACCTYLHISSFLQFLISPFPHFFNSSFPVPAFRPTHQGCIPRYFLKL